jgi:hypothetical protein
MNKFVLQALSYKFNVLHKHLHLRAYNIQLLEALKSHEQEECVNFATGTLDRNDATISSTKCASQIRRSFMSMQL